MVRRWFDRVTTYMTENDSYYGTLLHLHRTSGSLSRFPLYDEIGSARGLVNASGTVTDTYEMDTFGKPISTTGSTPNPYKFGGAWGYITDPSGFLQLGERFYWPELGRFIQQDPIGKGINWYAYVVNNALAGVDPTGLIFSWEWPDEPIPPGLEKAQNYAAGIGDKVSWGISRRIRAGMGPDRVDSCSGWYMAGEVTGIGLTAVAGSAAVREAGAWAAGRGWVEVTRWGAPGKWVMRGGPLRVNYWAARIPSQPPFGSSTWVSVPRSLLRWPGAADEGGWLWGTIKGLAGHRIYVGTPFGVVP